MVTAAGDAKCHRLFHCVPLEHIVIDCSLDVIDSVCADDDEDDLLYHAKTNIA